MKSLFSLFIASFLAVGSISAQQVITMGQTVQGTLNSSSPKIANGTYFDMYRYESPGNETVKLTLESRNFKEYLGLGTITNGEFSLLIEDEDITGLAGAELEYKIASAGSYLIVARPSDANVTGSYTLRLTKEGAPQPPATRAIKNLKIGETITDRLTSANEVLEDGSYAQRYLIQLAQGQTIQITLQGDDFDAYLLLQEFNGATVAQNDDGAGGTDARIDYTAEKAGLYVVIVNSLGEKEEGEFALFVEHKGGPTAGTATPAASTAGSATGRQIAVGQQLSGTLTTNSPKLSDNSFYDMYQIRGVPNTTVTITLESADFDTYLNLGVTTNGVFESLESNDDGGGGTNSLIVFTFKDARTYDIRANTLAAGEVGNYTLKVAAGSSAGASTGAGTPATGSGRQIAAGQRVTGTLNSSSLKADDDSYYDAYQIRGVPNTTITITYESADFDAYLNLGVNTNGTFESLATDDDSAGGTNSQLVYTFTDARTYEIRANTLSEGETGSYSLSVTSGGSAPTSSATTTPARSVAFGQTVQGELTSSSGKMDDDSYYDEYTLVGEANTTVSISMVSTDFDAFLLLGRTTNGTFDSFATNDDGDGGTNALITYTFADAGTYTIRANTVTGDQTGKYVLRVTKVGTYRPVAVNSLPEMGVNRTVNGELVSSSQMLPGKTSYSKDYRIRVGRNDNIEFTLDSEDFDSVLELLDSNYNPLDKNDDYTDGTNSQIVYRFAAAGTYVLRVSALDSSKTGKFTLKSRKR